MAGEQRQGWLVCGWQVKLCDPIVTHGAISEHFGDKELIYTVNHKKGGSTFVIITLENLDGF